MANILCTLSDDEREGLFTKTLKVVSYAQDCLRPTAVETDERAFASVWGEWVRYLQTAFGNENAPRASIALLFALRDKAPPHVVLRAQRRAAKFIKHGNK